MEPFFLSANRNLNHKRFIRMIPFFCCNRPASSQSPNMKVLIYELPDPAKYKQSGVHAV
jgi:hypothetical protein